MIYFFYIIRNLLNYVFSIFVWLIKDLMIAMNINVYSIFLNIFFFTGHMFVYCLISVSEALGPL